MTRTKRPRRRIPRVNREEGAVLILVLLVLLTVTATAVYTVNATTNELLGAGASRTAYQTESMANSLVDAVLAWVDDVGPATVVRHLAVQQIADGNASNVALDLTNVEPVSLAVGQQGTRLLVTELRSPGTPSTSAVDAIDRESLNRTAIDEVEGVVDVYDVYRYTGNSPGDRSDGYGTMTYLRATYTGRAMTHLPTTMPANPDGSAAAPSTAVRDIHVTTGTSRVVATSGPFTM